MATTDPANNNSSKEQNSIATPLIPADDRQHPTEPPPDTKQNALELEPNWNPDMALRHLSMLFEPGNWLEIRALDAVAKGSPGGTTSIASGIFWCVQQAVDAITEFLLTHTCDRIEVVHNPLNPAIVKTSGKMAIGKSRTCEDADIMKVRWICIHCDPKRATGTNSTDLELKYALEAQSQIHKFLSGRGFPEPVRIMTGNGGQLLYRVDMQIDDTETVRIFLETLAAKFGNEQVKVDTSVYNAASTSNLVGVPNRSGFHTCERPSRMACHLGWETDNPNFVPQVTERTFLESIPIDPHGLLRESLNDEGNASRFLALYGESVLYCRGIGCWLLWDGTRWKESDLLAVRELATSAMKAFEEVVGRQCTENPFNHALKKVKKFAINSNNLGRLDAMITIASGRRTVHEDELDAKPWLLTTENGTLDLKSGTLLPHDRAHRITKLANVRFDPDARSALWDNHLDVVFGSNAELIAYFQRWAGYCLTGDISARAFAVLYGEGCNGKSVTIEALAYLLGEYACHTPPSTFEMHYGGGTISNDLARLRGARLVIASETNLGVRLDAGLMKRVTGGERIAARFLHKEFFEFHPNFKMIMSTNNKPDMPGEDPAMWSRVKLIPFEFTIPQDKIDPQLASKFRDPEVLSAILASAVRGCLEFQKNGLQDPPQVTDAVSQYRNNLDFVANWLESECVVSDPKSESPHWEETSALYQNFIAWCERNGAPP